MRRFVAIAAVALALWPIGPAWARIRLNTLPVRERVEIQLDHASATLVEEERIVPLVAGVNEVDFAWTNTSIDPGAILFRVLPESTTQLGKIAVIAVSYPPNEPALAWAVSAEKPGPARVRISYLLGNLNKSFNYRAVASANESTLTLSEYLRVQNLANEEFGSSGVWAGFGKRFLKPIGVNETKEMLAERFERVPIRKTYTCNPAEFDYLDRAQNKLRVPMHYVLRNRASDQLGQAALPFGKVRIFQDDGHGATAFLGEDWGKFTPIDDEMRLFVGVAQDIVVRRTIEKNERRPVSGNLYHQDVVLKYEIENFKTQPVTLDVAENLRLVRNEARGDSGRDVEWELGSETTFAGGPDAERSTQEQLVFHAPLPPADAANKAQKVVHKLHVILKNEW
ncbi:MAG: hypothetical protein U1D55_06260 [Phycisphaerae bacterium]